MKTNRSPLKLIALCLAAVLVPVHAAVWHVRTNGNDSLSGASWEQAKRSVGNAMTTAAAGDALWVASGRFAERITVKAGVALYGGFAGGESELVQRDWTNHLSILDGTTNGVVVTINNAGPDTRVDGMVITGGMAIHGGGMKIVASAPVIANNRIVGNITDGAGAGISIWGFQILTTTTGNFPVITNNIIVENQSINDEGDGGGIGVIGSSPVIAWNLIARNTATRNGGGIACWRHSLPVIANNVIEANSASYDETTASVGGGGIFASATDLDGRPVAFAISAPRIINNVVAANGARSGGGIAVIESRLGAATIRNNSVIANNGSGIYWANTAATNDNNLVAFNTWGFERGLAGTSDAVIRFNNVFGSVVLGAKADYRDTPDRTGLDGNVSVEPRLANWRMREFHLQPDSPCRDAGSTSLGDAAWPDIEGQNRVQGLAVDIGADESDGTAWDVPTPVIHVRPAGNDGDGLSWATAKRTVRDGIATASSRRGGEVWVAEGTYPERLELPASVSLYGGFAGGESERDDRDPGRHPTILDGGGVPTILYVRNAGYRLSGIDGFTIQNGGIYTGGNPTHSDLTVRRGGRGAGIYCRVSAPIIANNLIRTNSLGSPYNSFESYGGGVFCYLSHARISGNTFTENEVLQTLDGNGGGIYLNESWPDIEGNVFASNHARNGAAIYAWRSAPHIVRNVIERNSLYNTYPLPVYFGSLDGAINLVFSPDFLIEANTIRNNEAVFGAGISLGNCTSGRVVNNLIIGNAAFDKTANGGGMGGGIYCMVNQNAVGIVVANNTLVGNTATANFGSEMGGAVAVTLLTNAFELANNIIAFNSTGIWRHPGSAATFTPHSNCLSNFLVNYLNLDAGPMDILGDPRFVDRLSGDFHLLAASPCVDAGTAVNTPLTDFDGTRRPLDGNSDGLAVVDIGAYEFDPEAGKPRFETATVRDGNLILTWNAAGKGMKLQQTQSLTTPSWQDVPGADGVTTILVPLGSGTAFFRLLKP